MKRKKYKMPAFSLEPVVVFRFIALISNPYLLTFLIITILGSGFQPVFSHQPQRNFIRQWRWGKIKTLIQGSEWKKPGKLWHTEKEKEHKIEPLKNYELKNYEFFLFSKSSFGWLFYDIHYWPYPLWGD